MEKPKSSIYRLTLKDLKIFGNAVLAWQTTLGLTDWEITIEFDETPQRSREDSEEAWCNFKSVSRVATIAIKKQQFYPFTVRMLKKAAFHEVAHLLIADLDMMATNTGCLSASEIDREVHKIIVRLSNVFFPDA